LKCETHDTLFVCTVCGQFIPDQGFVDNFNGKLTGVFCSKCARAVAVMREEDSRLLKAMKYLNSIGE